ncbi:MAG: hypothetical protein ACREM8_12535 [Vulcanimicrobiaceae bacterium]
MFAAILLASWPQRAGPAEPFAIGDAIFAKARAVWQNQRVPPLVRSRVRITYRRNGRLVGETYASVYNRAQDAIYTDSFSTEERTAPHRPAGLDCLVCKAEFFEPLGVPKLSPVYSFGIGLDEGPPPSPTAVHPAATPLPVIARIRVFTRNYRIAVGADEPCGGSAAYHLTLIPRRDRKRFRLRQLWIRRRDFATCRAIVAGNLAERPWDGIPWDVRFVDRPGGWVGIGLERAREPVRFHGETVADVAIAFDSIAANDTILADLNQRVQSALPAAAPYPVLTEPAP